MLGWAKKTALVNVVEGKHVTNGSTVKCVSSSAYDHQHRAFPVPYGTLGKVVASGKANAHGAKQHVGTTAAMQVEWDYTPAPRVGPVMMQGGWGVCLGFQKYIPEEPGSPKAAIFHDKAQAEAS